MLDEAPDIEVVVIALPLVCTRRSPSIACKAGKHVLCEKLMAWNIGQCKEMIKVADETDRILSIGHQRHYSMLYAHAVEVLNTGVLGDIQHIRALWHRNNAWPLLDDDGKPTHRSGDRQALVCAMAGARRSRTRIEAAARRSRSRSTATRAWRAGPLAALQPHRRRPDGRAGQPPARRLPHLPGQGASAGGHRRRQHCLYGFEPGDGKPNPREIDDHVFVTFEFPGKNHPQGAEQGHATRTTSWS